MAKRTFRDRFLANVTVDLDGPLAADGAPCWVWTAYINREGYSRTTNAGHRMTGHKAAYELWFGPVPDGLQIDHTCHDREVCKLGDECPHRRCVNPAHLEAVTPAVNSYRGNGVGTIAASKEECPAGHPYDGANLYVRPSDGGRICRECAKQHARNYRRRKRSEAA